MVIRRNTGYYFLGQSAKLKKNISFINFVCVWHFENFNMGVNGKIVKCAISWKGWSYSKMDENLLPVVLRSMYRMWGTFHVSLVSFRACCKVSNVKKFQQATAPPLFIDFQPNFMESMVVRGNTGCCFFGDLPNFMALWMKFLLTLDNMVLEILKHSSSNSLHPISAKLYEDIGYHGGTQAVTFLGNQPSFKNFVALWNFNMAVNGKIVKCTVTWNGWS